MSFSRKFGQGLGRYYFAKALQSAGGGSKKNLLNHMSLGQLIAMVQVAINKGWLHEDSNRDIVVKLIVSRVYVLLRGNICMHVWC